MHTIGMVLLWASLITFLAGAVVAFSWLTDAPENEVQERRQKDDD